MSGEIADNTCAHERIAHMDCIRGFALLGILCMNIECFVGPYAEGVTGVDPNLHGINRWVDAVVYILVQGKFYAIFSVLFGMGFGCMEQNAARNDRAFSSIYLRRIAGLLCIGAIHAIAIWSGDIITIYALLACLLLSLRYMPLPSYLVMATVLYLFIPTLLLGYCAIGAWETHVSAQSAALWQHGLAQQAHQAANELAVQRALLEHGSYLQVTMQRLRDIQNIGVTLFCNGPAVLAFFLVGLWISRVDKQLQGPAWQWCGYIGWPCGLLLMLCSVLLQPNLALGVNSIREAVAYFLWQLANALMCFGYMAWICKIGERLRWLEAVGRMSLTNYIIQSLLCTWIFNAYGLGGYEKLSRAEQIPFVIMVFICQVAYSNCWLRYFRWGPIEWLLRCVTYLKLQPLRRARKLPVSIDQMQILESTIIPRKK